MEIVLELVFQLVFELFGSVVSVAVGVVFGAVALVCVVAVRRALAHVSRTTEIADPDGNVWCIRVVFGWRQPLTRRLSGMTPDAVRRRRDQGHADAAVHSTELWHPSRLVDRFDEAVGLVAPFVAVAALLICIVFVVEIVVALPVAILLFVLSLLRSSWRVEMTDPSGDRSLLTTATLGEARQAVAVASEHVRAGLRPQPPATG